MPPLPTFTPRSLATSGSSAGMNKTRVLKVTLPDFLAALYPPQSDGLIELRALPGGAQAFVRSADLTEVQRFLEVQADRDLFLGIARRLRVGDGSLANCGHLSALFCDIDFKSEWEPEARQGLERLPLKVSLLINSGGGLHAYWLLREPLDLRAAEEADHAKRLLRRLALALGGDLASAEPARILRVPGTLNHKYTPPRRVLIETFNPDRRFNLGDFDDVLPLERERHEGRVSFEVPERIREGQRNDILYRLGRSLYARRMSRDAILAALQVENATRCEPPLSEQEVKQIAVHVVAQRDRPAFQAPMIDQPDARAAAPEPMTAPLVFPDAAWRKGPFATYREAMVGATHAPEAALFAGLWAAAAASLGRGAWFYLGMDVYPNVAITVFGASGDGKTTGARHGVDRLQGLEDSVGVLRGAGSGEGVVDWLRETKEAHLWFAEEYSEILIRAGWDGATIRSVITNLWDCPPEYELRFKKDKRRGEPPPKLIRPTLNLLVCTTPANFWRYLRDEEVESGYGSRWLYLTGARRPMIPRPLRPDATLIGAVEDALADLAGMAEIDCSLSDDARALWDDFCGAWEVEAWAPLTRAAVKRVPQYVIKLGMLYAAFESTLPEITAEQLKAAILVGHYAAHCADTLMRELKPGGFRSRLETRILEIVTETPLPAYRIKRQIGGGVAVEDVDRAIRVLERVGELLKVGDTREGRPVWGRRGGFR